MERFWTVFKRDSHLLLQSAIISRFRTRQRHSGLLLGVELLPMGDLLRGPLAASRLQVECFAQQDFLRSAQADSLLFVLDKGAWLSFLC